MKSQKKLEYTERIKSNNGQAAYGPENAIHGWAPLDRGHIGAMLKTVAKNKFEVWMDLPHSEQVGKKNWRMWEANKFTARNKRVLSTFTYDDDEDVRLHFSGHEHFGLDALMVPELAPEVAEEPDPIPPAFAFYDPEENSGDEDSGTPDEKAMETPTSQMSGSSSSSDTD